MPFVGQLGHYITHCCDGPGYSVLSTLCLLVPLFGPLCWALGGALGRVTSRLRVSSEMAGGSATLVDGPASTDMGSVSSDNLMVIFDTSLVRIVPLGLSDMVK